MHAWRGGSQVDGQARHKTAVRGNAAPKVNNLHYRASGKNYDCLPETVTDVRMNLNVQCICAVVDTTALKQKGMLC